VSPPAASAAAPPLLLASASPRRREILAALGYVFTVVPAAVEESEPAAATDPRALVQHNAALKAEWVAARFPEAVVLGADTTVFLDGEVFHKPVDLDDARRMLRRLSGRTHSVFTGLAVRGRNLALDDGVETRVTFRPLDDALIDRYFAVCHPLDKAGAYGIQDGGELIVARREGSLSNVVGLPRSATKQLLTRAGLNRTLPA
jgi:septum formation protein